MDRLGCQMLQKSAPYVNTTSSSDVAKIDGSGLVDVCAQRPAACVTLCELAVNRCSSITHMPHKIFGICLWTLITTSALHMCANYCELLSRPARGRAYLKKRGFFSFSFQRTIFPTGQLHKTPRTLWDSGHVGGGEANKL